MAYFATEGTVSYSPVIRLRTRLTLSFSALTAPMRRFSVMTPASVHRWNDSNLEMACLRCFPSVHGTCTKAQQQKYGLSLRFYSQP